VVIPGFALAYTFWFIIPLGAIVGVLIPKIVGSKTALESILYGIFFGLAIGILGGVVLSSFLNAWLASGSSWNSPLWWQDFARKTLVGCITLSLYSIPWTSAFAYLHSRQHRKTRASNT
jgi:Na+/H+ antiporter NhaA